MQHAVATLEALQDFLQALYRVDVAHRVSDFLVTDRRLARALHTAPGARDAPEQLLLQADGDTLEVSLYLDESLLAALPAGPQPRITAAHMDAFCKTLEGVSHFLYVIWRGVRDRTFSLLELELQAEVDKYATLATLIRRGYGTRPEPWLRFGLFERFHLAPGLAPAEAARYHMANAYAARYCSRLEQRYAWRWTSDETMCELRRFYRLDHPAKLRHITAA